MIHLPLVIIRECLSVPSLSTYYLCRFSSFSKRRPAVGAPAGGPSTLFPSDLPGEWQRPRHHLQGVSEHHLCGGQDPPACGQVCHLQRSYGGLHTHTSWVLSHSNGSVSQTVIPLCITVVSMLCITRPEVGKLFDWGVTVSSKNWQEGLEQKQIDVFVIHLIGE